MPRKKPLSQPARVLLASAFLVLFVVVSLLTLVQLRDRLQAPAPPLVYEEPEEHVPPPVSATYEDVYRLIDLQLISGPESLGWRRLSSQGDVDVREIFGNFPAAMRLTELARYIQSSRSPARLQVLERDGVIQLYWEDQLRLKLVYHPPLEPPAEQRSKVAIIMDDLGVSLATLQQVIDLGLAITPAILPGTERASASAALLRKSGREFMIHIPMEPRSYPAINPGADALLLHHTEQEIRRSMNEFLTLVPGAVGANNHMGSSYTEHSAPMRVVLDELKRHELFFIDSLTINSSVAFAEARKLGLPTAARDIFLDNREEVPYIREQLRKMVRLAQSRRQVIAICHPYPETLEAIRLEKDWLLAQGVDFVPASQMVRRYAEL
ncbi:MAG: divergent polysaccharide deacetylase family protein [Pelovirga sp.]